MPIWQSGKEIKLLEASNSVSSHSSSVDDYCPEVSKIRQWALETVSAPLFHTSTHVPLNVQRPMSECCDTTISGVRTHTHTQFGELDNGGPLPAGVSGGVGVCKKHISITLLYKCVTGQI